LLTFVAFGASLIWRGLEVVNVQTVLFAILALAARTLVLLPVLKRAGLDRESLRVVAWFGPRGLSTLLLVLLPVFAGIRGAEQLFTICCLVVLLSVLLHGSAIGFIVRRSEAQVLSGAAPAVGGTPSARAEPVGIPVNAAQPSAAGANGAASVGDGAGQPERVTLEEMQELERSGEPIVLLDVRTQRTFESDTLIARGAIRVPPDDAVRLATAHRIPWKASLVAYCA
jgi:hypothetical protein